MNYTYILGVVEPEEFNELKRQETDIINSVTKGFNFNEFIPKAQEVKTTFKYNPQRSVIGIYIERDGQQQLVVEREGLNESEEAVVISLYRTLEQKLDRLRLPKEKWVDSI